MQSITVVNRLADAEVDALAGQLLTDDHWDTLVKDDADVYRPDGSVLMKFRKGALSSAVTGAAWANLRAAAEAQKNDNRGMAAGPLPEWPPVGGMPYGKVGKRIYHALKADGTISNTHRANLVASGIVGYFDRYPRIPYCRLTAYNLAHPGRFDAARPMIESVDQVFAKEMPDRYQAQREIIEKTSGDFYINGTVFTTITVNKNWQTAVHKDAGDYAPGFGVMTVFWAGKGDGCYFCYPRYGIAVRARTGDVVLSDVHEWHGNTPFHGLPGRYERLSCVFYYRAKMVNCGSADEELARARTGVRTVV